MPQGLKPCCLSIENVAAKAATHKGDSRRRILSLTLLNEIRVLRHQPRAYHPVQLGKMSREEMVRARNNCDAGSLLRVRCKLLDHGRQLLRRPIGIELTRYQQLRFVARLEIGKLPVPQIAHRHTERN